MSDEEQAWADAILENPSDAQLLVWADWLEENGDEACEGVRWLVETEKRPHNYLTFFGWWLCVSPNGDFCHALSHSLASRMNCVWHDEWHPKYPVTANGYITALLDAARAYLKSRSLAIPTPSGL